MRVIEENELILVNSSHLCSGLITRFRQTINGKEESILDFFLVCKQFFSLIISMEIDEKGVYALTKYAGRTGVKTLKKSDHNMLIMKIKSEWNSNNDREERMEIFNLKN